MDQAQLDLFLAAILGGVIGGGLLMTTMYYHMKHLYIRYQDCKNSALDLAALNRAQNDILKLEQGMKSLCKELYERNIGKPK